MTETVEKWKLHEYAVDLESLTVFPKDREYRPVTVQPTITPRTRETYHLLVVKYTSGDSMNPTGSTNYECVDLYLDQARAHMMGQRIRKDLENDTFYKSHRATEQPLVIVWANGMEEKKQYWPWKGHFERVEEIAVYEVVYAGHPRKVTF